MLIIKKIIKMETEYWHKLSNSIMQKSLKNDDIRIGNGSYQRDQLAIWIRVKFSQKYRWKDFNVIIPFNLSSFFNCKMRNYPWNVNNMKFHNFTVSMWEKNNPKITQNHTEWNANNFLSIISFFPNSFSQIYNF